MPGAGAAVLTHRRRRDFETLLASASPSWSTLGIPELWGEPGHHLTGLTLDPQARPAGRSRGPVSPHNLERQ